MRVDYHCHTHFSQDSQAPMEVQCQAAIARGLQEIAFTEHEDYNPGDPTSFYFRPADYMQALARCREQFGDRLRIRAGIEISEPHRHADRATAVLRQHDWDFVLGSLHWVTPEVNTVLPEFFTAWCEGGWREAFRRYFTEMIALAEQGDFDVLAHIDYPARYGTAFFGDAYDIRDYEPILREVLRALIRRGKGIEINTSPLRRGLPNPNPPAVVVRWFREMGGEVLTVGSDAHAPQDVGADIDRALAIAREAGFTHIAVFERRQPRFVQIQD